MTFTSIAWCFSGMYIAHSDLEDDQLEHYEYAPFVGLLTARARFYRAFCIDRSLFV